jgi:Abortive infection C-terminus
LSKINTQNTLAKLNTEGLNCSIWNNQIMEKLKKVIEQYGRWSALAVYIGRIEAHIESDFSHSLENAKALLETIGKEICNSKGLILSDTSKINGVLKNAFTALGYPSDGLITQISTSLATIGQKVGDLRNVIGVTSHGKSLEELRERNNSVDLLTKEFLIDSVVIVSCFLIRAFESQYPRVIIEHEGEEENELEYLNSTDFNDYWDESYGEFEMGDYSYTASEILYNVDKQAYLNEYNAFIESEITEEE